MEASLVYLPARRRTLPFMDCIFYPGTAICKRKNREEKNGGSYHPALKIESKMKTIRNGRVA
jgi:hypothetical protein